MMGSVVPVRPVDKAAMEASQAAEKVKFTARHLGHSCEGLGRVQDTPQTLLPNAQLDHVGNLEDTSIIKQPELSVPTSRYLRIDLHLNLFVVVHQQALLRLGLGTFGFLHSFALKFLRIFFPQVTILELFHLFYAVRLARRVIPYGLLFDRCGQLLPLVFRVP